MEQAMKLWLEQFTAAVRQTFGARVEAIGIQGSHGRGEATDHSDIDVVVILDTLTYHDLKAYDAAISQMPRRSLICGFVSGRTSWRGGIARSCSNFTMTRPFCMAAWIFCVL